MVAATVAGVILSAIVMGGVTLQRTILLANDYFRATSDEMLAADWMSADLRAAIGVSVNTGASGQTLTLTMPSYLDPATGLPRLPAVTSSAPTFGTVSGTVDYGDPAAFPTVTYSVSAGKLLRTAGAHSAVISSSLQNFQFNCTDQGSWADVSISFNSKFTRQSNANTAAATTVRTIVYMRNTQRF